MNTSQANVVIHVSDHFNADQQASMQKMLGSIHGVGRVTSGAKPHLILVDYDPVVIEARVIVERVQDHGLRAQLIGM